MIQIPWGESQSKLHLYGTKCVQHVRILIRVRPETSRRVLTRLDELEHSLLVHPSQLTHQVHGCQAPVNPTDPQVLRAAVLLVEYGSYKERVWARTTSYRTRSFLSFSNASM